MKKVDRVALQIAGLFVLYVSVTNSHCGSTTPTEPLTGTPTVVAPTSTPAAAVTATPTPGVPSATRTPSPTTSPTALSTATPTVAPTPAPTMGAPTPTPTASVLAGCAVFFSGGPFGCTGTCGISTTTLFVTNGATTLTADPFGVNRNVVFDCSAGTATSQSTNLTILGAPGHWSQLTAASLQRFVLAARNENGGSCSSTCVQSP